MINQMRPSEACSRSAVNIIRCLARRDDRTILPLAALIFRLRFTYVRDAKSRHTSLRVVSAGGMG